MLNPFAAARSLSGRLVEMKDADTPKEQEAHLLVEQAGGQVFAVRDHFHPGQTLGRAKIQDLGHEGRADALPGLKHGNEVDDGLALPHPETDKSALQGEFEGRMIGQMPLYAPPIAFCPGFGAEIGVEGEIAEPEI